MTAPAIPEKIHHIYWTWNAGDELVPHNGELPMAEHVERWRALHPGHQHQLWRQDESWDFAKTHFPDLWPVFCGYKLQIQRCDMFRMMLLAVEGGIYSDLDVQPSVAITPLLREHARRRMIVIVEIRLPPEDCVRIGQFPIRGGIPEDSIRIANFWLASAPGHPICLGSLEEMARRAHHSVSEDYHILYTTGPDVISTVYNREVAKHDDVALVETADWSPYFTHHCAGSWRFWRRWQ